MLNRRQISPVSLFLLIGLVPVCVASCAADSADASGGGGGTTGGGLTTGGGGTDTGVTTGSGGTNGAATDTTTGTTGSGNTTNTTGAGNTTSTTGSGNTTNTTGSGNTTNTTGAGNTTSTTGSGDTTGTTGATSTTGVTSTTGATSTTGTTGRGTTGTTGTAGTTGRGTTGTTGGRGTTGTTGVGTTGATTGTTGTATTGGTAGGPQYGSGAMRTMGFMGCSMSVNVASGYQTDGGKRMWPPISAYGGQVVQNWTQDGSAPWQAFDNAATQYGKPTDIWMMICIFASAGVTDAEVQTMISNARKHAPGANIWVTGQPLYNSGHTCTLAGNGGAELTDTRAKAADNAANNVHYAGTFILNAAANPSEVSSDTCHASSAGEVALGNEFIAKFGK